MKKSSKSVAKIANSKARIVFYGVRTIHYAQGNNINHKRNYVAIETPDIVVEVNIILPQDHWQKKNRKDVDAEMNKLAKRFFPKAEMFLFYNKVTYRGIVPEPPNPPIGKKFIVEKKFS